MNRSEQIVDQIIEFEAEVATWRGGLEDTLIKNAGVDIKVIGGNVVSARNIIDHHWQLIKLHVDIILETILRTVNG